MGRNKFKGSDRQDKKMVKRNKSLGLPTNKDEGFCPFAQVDQSYGSAAPYTHTVGIASTRRTALDSRWTNIDVDLIRVIKMLRVFDGKLLNTLRWRALAPRSPRSRQRLATGGTDPEADLWWVPAARRSYSDPCGCRKGSAWSGDLGNAFASPTGTSSPGTNAELPGQSFKG